MSASAAAVLPEIRKTLLEMGALQGALLNSASFSCIATDEKGAIQVFNLGAQRMLGYTAADVQHLTPADLCDLQEKTERTVQAGFESLVSNAARGGEDTFPLTWLHKNGTRLPAMVSVTALRGGADAVIGFLFMGAVGTARKQAEAMLPEVPPTLPADETWKPVALVVDDDDPSAEVMRRFLEGEGLSVVRSISAEDGLREALRHTFSLIILDLQLYTMNGWQFLSQVHENGLQPEVPVIIVSGQAVECNTARRRGVTAALQKPIHFAELKTILENLGLLKAPGPAPSR